jgi:Protein of unknown function (DUF1573)
MRILLLLWVFIYCTACHNNINNEKTTLVSFEKDTLHLGKVKKGDKVDLEFYFANTGKEKLHIVNVGAECGCTKPEFEKNEIQSGDSSMIFAKYNSGADSGHILRSLVLEANTTPKLKVLYFTAEVQ